MGSPVFCWERHAWHTPTVNSLMFKHTALLMMAGIALAGCQSASNAPENELKKVSKPLGLTVKSLGG